MAKSMRSKREKRLRAIRRELVEPLYDKKDVAKQAALEAAMSAPKLPVRSNSNSTTCVSMEVEMGDGGGNESKGSSSSSSSLKARKKGFKVGKKKKRQGKWKPGRKHNI